MSESPIFSQLHVETTGQHSTVDRLDLSSALATNTDQTRQVRSLAEQALHALGALAEQVDRIAGDIAEIRARLG